MAFQAGRVRQGTQGKELVDSTELFDSIVDALSYVEGTPVSKDGNRPWIYDTLALGRPNKEFLMVGGRVMCVLLAATAEDIRQASNCGSLTDDEALLIRNQLVDMGYHDFVIPGPVWARRISLLQNRSH